jgi:type IV secretory pathway VirB10-like protein
MAEMVASEKKRRFFVVSALALIASVLVCFAVLYVFSPNKYAPESKVDLSKGSKVADRPAAIGGAGTVKYNENLIKFDEKKADEALIGGKSFIATPIGAPKQASPVAIKKNDEVEKRKAPETVTTQTASRSSPTKSPNDVLAKRVMEDLASLDGKISVAGGPAITFTAKPGEATIEARGTGTGQETSDIDGGDAAPRLKSGDVLYALVTTGVNSDVPAPVTATVLSGAFRRSKLIGAFQRFEERLVVVFSRLVRPDGSEVPIEAYAVDPQTTEASVASNVDTHFFSRWGGLIAASFLEGLGEAKRYSGASSYAYGNNLNGADQMVWGNYSVADQAWIAAGKVGQRSGRIMEKNFDRVPTVYLEAGTQIGVLVNAVKK